MSFEKKGKKKTVEQNFKEAGKGGKEPTRMERKEKGRNSEKKRQPGQDGKRIEKFKEMD